MVLNLGMHQVCARIIDIDELFPIGSVEPYKIYTAEDFASAFESYDYWLNDPDYGGWLSVKDDILRLSLQDDIDMEGLDFIPYQLADAVEIFIDGNGHTVKNLKFTGYDGAGYSGLVPRLAPGAVIKNIRFEDIDVTLPSKNSGVLTGFIGTGVEITNCFIGGKVKYTCKNSGIFGGLAAVTVNYNPFVVKDITVDLEFDLPSSVSTFGGVIGNVYGANEIELSNLVNRSKKTLYVDRATWGIGGIFGLVDSSVDFKTHDCSNYMSISCSSTNVGGIVGAMEYVESTVNEIYNCTNNGNIYSDYGDVGGIAGYTGGARVYNCVNLGNIKSYDPSAAQKHEGDDQPKEENVGGVGGIVGRYHVKSLSSRDAILSSCINLGYVSSIEDGNVADIVGRLTSASNDNYQVSSGRGPKIFPFRNCLSLSLDHSNSIVKQFVFSNDPDANILGGLYSDASLGKTPSNDSIHILSNSELTSGNVPFYYYNNSEDNAYWYDNPTALANSFEPPFMQKKGFYPYLDLNDDIAKLASLPVLIAEGERLDSIASGFTCGMTDGVVWASAKGKFVVSDDGVATILAAGEDTLYGYLGNAVIARPVVVDLTKNVFGGGRGTEDKPYLLKTLAHLEELRDSLATEPGWSKNHYFKLAANISDLDFALSPNRQTAFMGNLDGAGYSITMNIADSKADAALFVFVENATIHDLQTSGSVSGKDLAAGVCAAALNSNIYNCFNSAKISAATAGGVVAYSNGGNLYGLCNSGSIKATEIAGGVIGKVIDFKTSTRISDLVNSGFVYGSEAAGLIGVAEKISASYAFNRLINYGSVYGTSEAYPYIFTSQFSGFTFPDCHYDIQISRNGKCETSEFAGASVGTEILPTSATDVAYELVFDGDNAVYIPSFTKDMRNVELLGLMPTFENEELTSFVQTSPLLLTEGKLILRKLGDSEEFAKLSDLISMKDVPAVLAQKSEFGEERETYINIAAIPFRSGDGSEADPYLINSLDDLKSLADLIQQNKVTDKYYMTSKQNNWSYNKHFKLTTDILGDGTGSSIVTEAIASLDNPFQGVFDGDGHTIKVSINNQNSNYQALFANIETGAVIENLKVVGVVNGKMCVAGVVACATDLRDGDEPVIRNVISNVDVTSTSECIGGICGKSSARIEDCANAGTISVTFDSNPYYTGGIVGSTTSNVIRCMNIGTVHGHRRVGGIAGYAMNDDAKGLIKDCVNYGMISSQCPPSAEFACLGGIVGSADNFDVETSLNLGRVSCRNEIEVDAIVGSATGEVKNCYYDKQVSALSSNYGTGLLTTEISALSLEPFKNNAGMYPTLTTPLNDEEFPILAMSSLMLYENEDKTVFDDVTKMSYYGDVNVANANVKWTSKNGVVEVVKTDDGYIVKPVAVGSDTLTASYGSYSKQVSVDIYCIPVRIDTTISGCQMVSVRKSDGFEIICKNDTTFTEVYPRENSNCDSTIKYIVKINKLKDYMIDTVLCGKDVLSGAVYRGINYTNADYITRYDTVGCDSAITTRLRVVIPRVDSTYFNSGCDSVFCEVDGKYHYKTVSFYDTLRSKTCGCDSVIIKVNLNVTNSDGYEFDEVYLDSFIVDGKKLVGGESITLTDTLVTKNGCDSIVKKNIYVYDRVYKMDTVIYACDFYLDNVNFKKITHDTVLVEQLSETLHGIVVDGYYLQRRDVRIAHNTVSDTTRIPDEYYCERYRLTENVGGVENVIGYITRDTVVLTNIPRDKKCDSVLVRTIHILPAPVKDTVEIVNCGDFYDETLDTTFTATQDYVVRRKFNNSHCDCDSSISLRRYTIRTTKHNTVNISGCSEAQYTFYGNVAPTIFTSSVDTMEVIQYTSGPVCDSIINTIHIAVANPIYDTVSKSTCGDTIMYAGKVYLASDGDYKETITYRSAAGCDSLIRFLDFRFVETIENVLPTKYGCDSVVCEINNKVYYEDHTISVEVGVTEQGCPIFNTQSVVVLHPTTSSVEVMGCEFAEFNGGIYYNDTTLQLHLKSTLCDCDSFVNVKILVLPRIESPTIYLSDCDSVTINDPENGEVVIKEDVDDYQCLYQKVYNVAGKEYICDSIVHYNVHVKKPTYNSVVISGESSVVYGGQTYRRSQVIRDTLVNAEGCDSFVEIKIIVEKDLGYPVIVDKFGYTLFCNNNIGPVKFATYQWYKDGVAIQGATKEYYEGAKGEKLNGCYYVEVTSVAGKEFVSETYCVDKERELKIYPNPVSPDEVLTIDYPFTDDEKKNLRVEIYDAIGIMVDEFMPTSYPIQMNATLQAGHYFVMIFVADDRILDTRFIVR
ncbi:MAG: hypothetical protein KBT22_09575 [Bacteroidales bacterium]|nr:hypothetical protein [Candidatus Scybalocola fimicaballi]